MARVGGSGAPPPTWHRLPAGDALKRLDSSPRGLSSGEAERRLAEHGPNALHEASPIRPLAILRAQFGSLVVWLLIGAGLVSGFLGEWLDASAVLGIVVLNALIGFFQEYRAESSLAALRKMTAPNARVRRDGSSRLVPAAGIVPGDVVELEAGDLVPGDARLLEAHALRCNEAPLTGESEPVEKGAAPVAQEDTPLGDRASMAFLGTSVAAGRGVAVVVATGMATEMGRIASLLRSAAAEGGTPLQKRLQAFGKVLVWASLGIVGVLFVIGLARGTPLLGIFLASVSLAVAAVPEGLPAIVTIALAIGVQRMARRRTLVRKLHAVETLGSTTVICSDKTGTLTVGQMTVRALRCRGVEYAVTGEGFGPDGDISGGDPAQARELLRAFAACCTAELVRDGDAWVVLGDPTEGALLAAARKAGVHADAIEREMPSVVQIPFDSDRKRMTVIRRLPGGGFRAFVKGAPEVLLSRSANAGAGGDWFLRASAEMAERGLRVLASAYRDLDDAVEDPEIVERDLVLVGIAGMYDPPRPEAREAVKLCRAAGIRPVMITGDHPRTALAIARELDIARDGDVAVPGSEIDRMSDAELGRRVGEIAVYARVTAEHKLRIVRAWRASGGVVAMTGDGVNDAPAIKGADIGIAMGRSGTEVTKEASDMVITDDNFATIVAAVEEGRGIYDNIRKTIQYLLAGNTAELLLMTVCVALGMPLPLLPIQLLWINLVTDGLPALCLAVDPIDREVMNRPPRAAGERIADSRFLGLMGVTGVMTAGVTFLVYRHALGVESVDMARAHAFAVLVFAELARSFGCRSSTKLVWEIGLLTNLKLALVVAVSFAFQLWSHHSPILERLFKTPQVPWRDCGMLILFSLAPSVALEAWKLVRRTL